MYIEFFLLNLEIEMLRSKLHTLISYKSSLTDSRIIECSQELDKLLVSYEKFKLVQKVA